MNNMHSEAFEFRYSYAVPLVWLGYS